MKRTKLAVGIAATALLLFCVAAQADIITYTQTLGPTAGTWSGNFTIPKFDASLGTLRSVKVTFLGSMSGSVGWENTHPTQPKDGTNLFTADVNANLSVTLPTTTVVPITVGDTLQYNLTKFDGTIDYAGTSGATTALGTYSGSSAITYTLPADLALFIGSGNLVIPITATSGFSNLTGFAPGHYELSNLITSYGNIKVEYDYFIPEPGSLALLGLGLPMAGVWLRRRRSKQP